MFLGLRTDSAVIDNGPAGNRVFSVVDEDGRIDEIAVFMFDVNLVLLVRNINCAVFGLRGGGPYL